MRHQRLKQGWTLQQMAETIGIPRSTLAKVERDRLTLTYDKLRQLTLRLQISMTEFLGQSESPTTTSPVITARRSVARNGTGVPVTTAYGDYEFLCAELRDKRMVPLIATLRAHDSAELGEPLGRTGEEFVFVLEGSIEVKMQCYTPVTLITGQGIYLDSSMPHAYVAKNCTSAVVLAVCCGPDPTLMDRLSGIPRPSPQSRATDARRASLPYPLRSLKTYGSGRKEE